MGKRCVIITALVRGNICELVNIESDDLVVCADGGWVIATEQGVIADVVIGDFDSSEPPSETDGDAHPKIIKLAKEKDDTDTLACVKYALAEGIQDFVIVGGLSGELAHTLANIQVLSFLADMQCTAKIVDGGDTAVMLDGVKLNFFEYMTKLEASTEAAYVEETGGVGNQVYGGKNKSIPKDSNTITIEPTAGGGKFAVFSYEVRSEGIFILGAKYELKNAHLTQSYPIGVSNEFVGDAPVTVAVRRGRLLVVY
jgi:thiamine pyrophosphokinase